MDDNTRQVLIALIGVLGGMATGVLLAQVTGGRAAAMTRQQWEREDGLRAQQAARARGDRWLDRRREVYANLLGKAASIAVNTGDPPANELIEALALAEEIGLINRPLGVLAMRLVQEAMAEGRRAEYGEEGKAFTDASSAFRTAAASDLDGEVDPQAEGPARLTR